MNKAKKLVAMVLISSVIGGNFVTLAKVPEGSAVLGTKGYTLEYVNDEKNKDEILKLLMSNDRILIKAYDGQWYDNLTGDKVEEYSIPEIKYLDEKGKSTYYKEEDGEKVDFNLEKINYLSKNTISVEFTNPFKVENIKNKENYLINGKALSEKDKLELREDNKGIIITLDEPTKEDNFNSSVTFKNICDENGRIKEDISKDIFVISKSCKELNKQGDINIIGDNVELKNFTIEGNVYISGERVTLKNITSNGDIILTDIESGDVLLDNCKAKSLNIGKTNHIDKLTIKGMMNILNDNKKSVKDLNFYASSKDKEVVIKGDFSKLNVKSKGKINIGSNSNIDELNIESDIKLMGHKSSQVKNLNVTKGATIDKGSEFAINIEKESIVNIKNNSGGTSNTNSGGSGRENSNGTVENKNNGSGGSNNSGGNTGGESSEDLKDGDFIDMDRSKIVEVEGSIYAVMTLKNGNINDYEFYLDKEEIQCKKVNTSGTIVKFELKNNKDHCIIVKNGQKQQSIKLSI